MTLIPLVQRKAITGGVDKGKLLEGSCRRQWCTYAHSWNESSKWIWHVCSKHDTTEHDQRWDDILQYNHVGTLSRLDGRIVADFLDTARINKMTHVCGKPFPLLFCFAVTNAAPEDTNAVLEDP